jgi:hypothetical protein
MHIDLVIWDDEDDPVGNYQHIVGAGEVTSEEVEDVLYDPETEVEISRSSGRLIAFGWTADGRRIAVVFVFEPDPALVLVRPKTAYPVKARGE